MARTTKRFLKGLAKLVPAGVKGRWRARRAGKERLEQAKERLRPYFPGVFEMALTPNQIKKLATIEASPDLSPLEKKAQLLAMLRSIKIPREIGPSRQAWISNAVKKIEQTYWKISQEL